MHGCVFSIGIKFWFILKLCSSDSMKIYSTPAYSPLPRPDVSPADARLRFGSNKTGTRDSNCLAAKLPRVHRGAAVLHHSPSSPYICFECAGLFPSLLSIPPHQPSNWQLHIFFLARVMAIAARAAALRFSVRLQASSISADVLFVMRMAPWKHPSSRL